MHVNPGAFPNGLGKDPVGVAGEQASRARAIRAEIRQGSSAQGRNATDIVFFDPDSESCPNVLQGSDRPFVEQALYKHRLRVLAIHEPFNAYEASLLGDVKRTRSVLRTKDEGFLAQHMLAGLECLDGPLCMKAVRQGDVDGVHAVRIQELFVRAVTLVELVLLRETPC
jgi:hypothetical protein